MMNANRSGKQRRPRKMKLTRRKNPKKRRRLELYSDASSESSISAENSSVSLDDW
nr:ORF3 [Torque teno felis virus]